ncbi:pyridoxal 5'-phosphate synthase lyase subunit PdxS [Euryarchaeota archaeon]|nr:pyridoxal 5'-phosphate synthase lyase subunit PdxS [Euryarchaeota archaeon]MDC0526774.1 pyridoxal 5'-phosphate synthase lyase subunit PdxS [Euryarchaeota archaeon]
MSKELDLESLRHGKELVKRGFARMQKGGVIMDVVNAKQAKIAEDAGAVAVMALERVPSDIRADGGVARMSNPNMIKEIIECTTIPVMAKCRIGHTAEAKVLEALGVDMIDESEVLTPADPYYHVVKDDFTVPFVCGATSLGEAVRRIWEGSAMIRTKGEAGTGNVVAAMRHARLLQAEITAVQASTKLEKIATRMVDKFFVLDEEAKGNLGESAGYNAFGKSRKNIEGEVTEILGEIKKLGRLPVVTFTAGGIATPADAALMMQFGMDGIFVGSGIFKSEDPTTMAKAVVEATAHFDDAKLVGKVSEGLGDAMAGLEESKLDTKMAKRGH